MALLFSGLYEPRLIGRQESRLDSRDRAILADCRSEEEYSLAKKIKIIKHTKGKNSIRSSFLERKGGPFALANGG